MDKHEAARVLEEIALYLEIQGENPYKVRAYHNAAHALEGLDEDLLTVVQEGRLEEIPNIGERIAKKITELVQKGSLSYHQRLKGKVPAILVELMDVPGLGAKKAKYLYKRLKITNIEELTQACQEGRVAELPGFGEKSQKNILRSISRLKTYGKRVLWWNVGKIVLPMLEKLSQLKEVEQVEIAGSFRRRLETIGDLDFIVASSDPEPIMAWFTKQSIVELVQAKGKTKSSVRLRGGIQADLRIVPQEQFAFALLYFTGSKDFNILLRQRANHLGYTLNEYELQPLDGSRKRQVRCSTEEQIFRALYLDFIPPELREGGFEIEAAEKGQLPKLVESKNIRGVFHCHTTDSDGHNNLEEMALAAEKLGWEYLGIADHSKSSFQANGMDEKRLYQQIESIDVLNRSGRLKIHLFTGLECDILIDGRLDFSDDILKKLDYVIVSIHSHFKSDEKTMTSRLIKAIENPYSTIVGHVSGRLLLYREPYAINLPKVIDACIANHKVMEINAQPMRLDMDWRLWHKAAEKGLMCSINPDAHSTAELHYYQAGVNVARKGWLEKSQIINTMPLSKIKKFLASRRQQDFSVSRSAFI